MHYAERLYLNGLTSYPRTETSKYAEGFDIYGTLRTLADRDDIAEWLPEARELMCEVSSAASASQVGGGAAALGALLAARASTDGIDVGDHPPITPVKAATPRQCEGEVGWALYQYICRHYVASLSDDCTFETATLHARLGGEDFEASATRCVCKGWTRALRVPVIGEEDDDAQGGEREEEEEEEEEVVEEEVVVVVVVVVVASERLRGWRACEPARSFRLRRRRRRRWGGHSRRRTYLSLSSLH